MLYPFEYKVCSVGLLQSPNHLNSPSRNAMIFRPTLLAHTLALAALAAANPVYLNHYHRYARVLPFQF